MNINLTEKTNNLLKSNDKYTDIFAMYFRYLLFIPLLDAVLINFGIINIGLGFVGNFVLSTIILIIYAKVKYDESPSDLIKSVVDFAKENITTKNALHGLLEGLFISAVIGGVVLGVMMGIDEVTDGTKIIVDIFRETVTWNLLFAIIIYSGLFVAAIVATQKDDEKVEE